METPQLRVKFLGDEREYALRRDSRPKKFLENLQDYSRFLRKNRHDGSFLELERKNASMLNSILSEIEASDNLLISRIQEILLIDCTYHVITHYPKTDPDRLDLYLSLWHNRSETAQVICVIDSKPIPTEALGPKPGLGQL